jgi:hypothetical protein
MQTKPGHSPEPIRVGADGGAISNDGSAFMLSAGQSAPLQRSDRGAPGPTAHRRVAETVRDEGKNLPQTVELMPKAASILRITNTTALSAGIRWTI